MNIQSMGQSSLFQTANISQNRTAVKWDNPQQNKSLFQNRDSLSLSPQGKKASLVNQLMDQKKLLTELRDYTMQKGIKDGYIDQNKLDEYDKQLKALDEQITKAMMEETHKNMEEAKSSKKKKTMTKEEYEQRKMAAITSLSSEVGQANIVMSEKEKVDSKARILKVEIKQDGPHVLESKFERVAELEAQSHQLMREVQGRLVETNTSIQENVNNKDNIEIEDEENTAQKENTEATEAQDENKTEQVK